MCARLREELDLDEARAKVLVDTACDQIGVDKSGSLVERARACLESSGYRSKVTVRRPSHRSPPRRRPHPRRPCRRAGRPPRRARRGCAEAVAAEAAAAVTPMWHGIATRYHEARSSR